ncbi:MAG: SRPBCC domain-containing protein [Roseiarcus sp.]
MGYDFELGCDLPALAEAVYRAWLSSDEHSEMTGAEAEASDVVGARYTAWDGYIEGRNLELVPFRRIVQSWRTSEFAESDPDSTVTLELTPIASGTRIKLSHNGVPDGQTSYEKHGWREYYFEPMKAYFARRAAARQPRGP